MDCDRVFMILTSGPFPNGGPEDEAVQDHLDGCLPCWRIAQALRPWDDPVATSSISQQGLPGYWVQGPGVHPGRGRLAQAPTPVVTVATPKAPKVLAQRLAAVEAARRTASVADLSWVVGTFVLVGVCVLLGWWLMSPVGVP